MPNPNIPNRSLHASYEIIARNLSQINFATAVAGDGAAIPVLQQNGYVIDRVFNDPVTGLQAVGLRSNNTTRPPLLVFNGTNDDLDEAENRNTQGAGFNQFSQNSTAIRAWLTAITADITKNPQRLFPDVTGHSLGGSLTQWTAATFPTLISEAIIFEGFGLNTGIANTFTQNGGVTPQVTHYVNSGDIVPLQGQEFIPGAVVLATYTTPAIDPQDFVQKHLEYIVPGSPATTAGLNITYREISTTELNNPNFSFNDRDWNDFILALRQSDPTLAQSLTNRQSAEPLRTQLSYFGLAGRINALNPNLAAGYAAATQSGLRPNPGNNILEVTSTTANQGIRFTSVSRTGSLVNEIGLFRVDDDRGSINGILPGATGYLQAALNRGQVIFSSLSGNFFDANSQRQISFNPGNRFQLYSVQNSTTAQALQNLSSGQAAPSILFANPLINNGGSSFVQLAPNGSNLNVTWNDGTTAGANEPNLVLQVQEIDTPAPTGSGLQGTSAGEVLDLRNLTGQVQVTTNIRSDAAYNNTLGLYQVDDITGRIGTLNPGDAGYAEAALRRAVLDLNKSQASSQQPLTGGSLYAPFLVSNGTIQDFLARNISNTAGDNIPVAYFNYVAANPDRVDHIQLLGDNKFGFEDLLGGGDRDYNDLVVQFNIG
jgi:pimeloyl-ACP methyl ester carboxylesterase